jgi:hypothetical protein
MSSEAFAASRDFSSLLGQLMQQASAPADDTLAWLQQQYWQRYYDSKRKEEEGRAKRGARSGGDDFNE